MKAITIVDSASIEAALPARGGALQAARRMVTRYASGDVRRGVFSVADQAVVSGTSFLTTVAVGRFCSPEQLGIYFLALSIVLFMRDVQAELTTTPYTIYCNRRRGDALASYSGSILVHCVIFWIACSVLLAVMAGVVSLGAGPRDLLPVVGLLVVVAPLILLREFIRHVSFAHLEMSRAVAVDVTVCVIQLAGLFVLGMFGWLSPLAAYLVMAVGCGLAAIGWFANNRRPLEFRRSAWLPDWQKNWKFGRWALATHLIGSATPYLMPWLLVILHGEGATGLFAACCALVGLANLFVVGVSNFLMPRAARAFTQGGVDALAAVLWKTVVVFIIALSAFCLIAFTTGEQIAQLVFGPQFSGSEWIIAVLSLSVLVHSVGTAVGIGLLAIERPRANFAGDTCTLVTTLIAAALLVAPLGVLGVAIAVCVGNVAGTIARCCSLAHWLRTLRSEPRIA